MTSHIPRDRTPPGPARWPEEAVPAWVHPVARTYLLNRGLCKEEIEGYLLHFCDGGNYRNRILIPIPNVIVPDHAEHVGTFQARIITPTYTGKYKYLTAGPRIPYVLPLEGPPGSVLYLLEGPFDAWSVARAADRYLGEPVFVGALLGYKASEMQLDYLSTLVARYQIGRVRIWLDAETTEEAYRLAEEVQPFAPVDVIVTDLAKDPGEMSPEQAAQIMKA